MSILNKLRSLFERPSRVESQPEIVDGPGSNSKSQPQLSENVLYIYSHGFTNGVYRIEPESDHFNDFLLASNESQKVAEQRRQAEARLAEAKAQLNSKQSAMET